ncbi:MAG TPA: ZIP family metal transporter [Halanaerobiales bacterium]|nr:ZIP family metal transporter [Halanaerobiales bacterium]
MGALLYSFIAGVSTALGVVVLLIFGKPKEKFLAMLLGFAGGIMLAISVFELLPEAVVLSSMTISIISFIFGALMMFGLDKLIPHSHLSTTDHLEIENPEKIKMNLSMLRTGYLIFFGIGLHNLPEGIAIGAGFESSPEIGLYIAIAIALHNVPEGLAIAGPLKTAGIKNLKIIIFALGAGLMTVVGTFISLLIFNITKVFVGGFLAFAAGAMIYIVNDELIPQSNIIHNHFANAGIIIGLLLGFAML